jgi:RHS repeat-associated protein
LSTATYGTSGIIKNKLIQTTSAILGSNDYLINSYSYDVFGFVTSSTSNSLKNLTPASITTTTEYDRTGLILGQQINLLNWQLNHGSTYDHRGRLRKKNVLLNGNSQSFGGEISEYHYNHRNEVIRLSQGKTNSTGLHSHLQHLDYTYRTHGLLDAINQPLTSSTLPNQNCNNISNSVETIDAEAKKDLYYNKLSYDINLPSGTTPRYTGEISADTWQIKGRKAQHYVHIYDVYGRLTQSSHYEDNVVTNRYDQSQTYDARGNILTLRRRSMADCNTTTTIDSLTYTYQPNSNLLSSVIDQAPCPSTITLPPRISTDQHVIAAQSIIADSTIVDSGVNLHLSASHLLVNKYLGAQSSILVDKLGCGSGTYYTNGFSSYGHSGSYLYDQNGNLTYDPYKQVTIRYNHLDLPDTFLFVSGNKIIHTYDAGGNILRKRTLRSGTVIEDRFYIGSGEWLSDTLEVLNHSQGQLVRAGLVYQQHYFILDHLSNTRVVYHDSNNDGIIQAVEVLQTKQYYPYGMAHQQKNNANISKNEYLYNGIRLESDWGLEWGMTSYRGLDATLGRWWQIDPKVESMADDSPYVAMGSNPVSMSDPMGDSPTYNFSPLKKLASSVVDYLNYLISGPLLDNPSGVSHDPQKLITDLEGTQIVLTDWYIDPETQETFWLEGSEEIEGLKRIGRFHVIRGLYGSVLQDQRSVLASGNHDYVAARYLQMTTSAQPVDAKLNSEEKGRALMNWGKDFLPFGLGIVGSRGILSHPRGYRFTGGFGESYSVAAKGGGQGGLNLFKWGAEQTGKSTGWKAGDYMLHLPNKGTPALNWKANYGALRSEMNLGKPIFDSYRLPNGNLIPTGGFLNAERFTLQSRGWIYNPGQGAWLPPIR